MPGTKDDPLEESCLWIRHPRGPLQPPLSLVLTGPVARPCLAVSFPKRRRAADLRARTVRQGASLTATARRASAGRGPLAQDPRRHLPSAPGPLQPSAWLALGGVFRVAETRLPWLALAALILGVLLHC